MVLSSSEYFGLLKLEFVGISRSPVKSRLSCKAIITVWPITLFSSFSYVFSYLLYDLNLRFECCIRSKLFMESTHIKILVMTASVGRRRAPYP